MVPYSLPYMFLILYENTWSYYTKIKRQWSESVSSNKVPENKNYAEKYVICVALARFP